MSDGNGWSREGTYFNESSSEYGGHIEGWDTSPYNPRSGVLGRRNDWNERERGRERRGRAERNENELDDLFTSVKKGWVRKLSSFWYNVVWFAFEICMILALYFLATPFDPVPFNVCVIVGGLLGALGFFLFLVDTGSVQSTSLRIMFASIAILLVIILLGTLQTKDHPTLEVTEDNFMGIGSMGTLFGLSFAFSFLWVNGTNIVKFFRGSTKEP